MPLSKLIKKTLDQEIDPAFAQRAGFVFECIEDHKPKTVLDIGCGRGFYSNHIAEYSFVRKVVGIDLKPEYIEKAKKYSHNNRKINFKIGSIYKLPYKNDAFDAIICSEVLEHLPSESKALHELKRVLKPGGIVVATVPHESFPFLWDPLNWILTNIFKTHIDKNIWWLAGIWADHERLYTEKAIKKLFLKDFSVLRFKKFVHWCWPFSHFLLYAIGKNIIERIPVKNFDRFERMNTNPLAIAFAFIFSLPSRILDRTLQTSSSVNLGICVKKIS